MFSPITGFEMRAPSSQEKLYAWHAAALAGQKPPVHENDPHCGWYMRKLIKGGPFVPVSIYVEREVDPENGELLSPEVMVCEIAGQRRDVGTEWTWVCQRPISEDQFMDMLAGAFRDEAALPPIEDTAQERPAQTSQTQPAKTMF